TENLVNFPANADGGTGGSVGIQVVLNGAKAPHIHDNTITAGNGNATNGVGNIGVHLANTSTTLVNVTRAAGAALEHNVITGGRGQGFGDVSNVGLQLEGNLVADVLGNTIWAGEGPLGVNVDAGLAPLTSATIGLRMFNHASANIEGNRIFGGVSTSRGGGTVGIACIGGDAIVVTNNLIHGGNDSPGPPNAAAIELVETASATIEDNTIYAGLGASGDGGISNALFEHDLDAAVAVRGNILAGAGSSAADVAIVVDKCGQIGPFDHNLFVNLAGGMLSSSTCHKDGGAKLSGFAETEALLHGTDNLVLATSCDAGQPDATICGVSSCPSVGSCLTGLLTQWAPNGGGSSILDKGSWALTDASSCRIKRGGVNLAQQAGGPAIPNDYSDAGRPDAPSIGAYQSGGTCPP
ncbi:MAG TPA: hypothetical protein VN770_08920, partial [Gaiellaceae bacterium]|nr:hypothetical protein [Gaiellaceae bacterium]